MPATIGPTGVLPGSTSTRTGAGSDRLPDASTATTAYSTARASGTDGESWSDVVLRVAISSPSRRTTYSRTGTPFPAGTHRAPSLAADQDRSTRSGATVRARTSAGAWG